MKISCYLSQTCGSAEQLETNIALALEAEGIEAAVRLERLDDEDAARRGLSGSPSVFIDGTELQPLENGQAGFS